jgi:hypothetical protein
MKAVVKYPTSAGKEVELVIDHRDRHVVFSIAVFRVKSFTLVDVFEEINMYWADKPIAEQDAIFQIYKEMSTEFDTTFQKDAIRNSITALTDQLMSYHRLSDISAWVGWKSKILIPTSGIPDKYEHNIDSNKTRAKTYIRSEYIDLVCLSLALRAMIPIWGEYEKNTHADYGTLFKEYHAFQLLRNTEFIDCPAMDRLKEYVEHVTGSNNSSVTVKQKTVYDTNTLKGICRDDFAYRLLAKTCVKKVCVGDISGKDPDSSLVAAIYKFVMSKATATEANYENQSCEKKPPSTVEGEENKMSTLEQFNIRTVISPGDIVMLEHSVSDPYAVARALSYNVDDELLTRSLETSQVLLEHRLRAPQMNLLRLVMKPVISPKGIMYLPKDIVVKLFGVLEHVLWVRGHKYLSILSTSYAPVVAGAMVISPVDSKMRVPVDMLEELDRIYPFMINRDRERRNLPTKVENRAAIAIDTIMNDLISSSWRSTADESMLDEIFKSTSRRVSIRPDSKTDLAKLMIELGNRNWK